MEPELEALLVEQHGVALRVQVLELVTEARLRVLVKHGALVPLRHGVYAHGTSSENAELEQARLQARAELLVRRRDEVVAGRAAAAVHGLPLLGGPAPVRVALPREDGERRRTSRPTTWLSDRDVVDLGGLRVTSLARTAVDVARTQSFAAAVVTADAAMRLGLLREEALEVVERCRRWPGSRAARRVVEFADPRPESPLESLGRARFEELGVPRPQLQHDIGPYTVDHYWEATRVVGEADGRLKYEEPGSLYAEKKREDWLRDTGREVVRYDWDEALRRPREIVARLHDAAARSRRRTA